LKLPLRVARDRRFLITWRTGHWDGHVRQRSHPTPRHLPTLFVRGAVVVGSCTTVILFVLRGELTWEHQQSEEAYSGDLLRFCEFHDSHPSICGRARSRLILSKRLQTANSGHRFYRRRTRPTLGWIRHEFHASDNVGRHRYDASAGQFVVECTHLTHSPRSTRLPN
jgi:hypothetical protein